MHVKIAMCPAELCSGCCGGCGIIEENCQRVL
jgi:hypothetical protein